MRQLNAVYFSVFYRESFTCFSYVTFRGIAILIFLEESSSFLRMYVYLFARVCSFFWGWTCLLFGGVFQRR